MPESKQPLKLARPLNDAWVANQASRQLWGRDYVGRRPLNRHVGDNFLGRLPVDESATADIALECQWPVRQLQESMAQGSMTAQTLVAACWRRLLTDAGLRLNAVVELNPDAPSMARTLDEERAAGHLRGALHGIPVLLKDNIGTGDQLHTTAGALALRDAKADRDAQIVRQLRAAGAIILGKTNLSEWANFMTTASINGFSAIGGHTRNPHGRFDVGGSSAGSAVAVAAGFAPLAIGTETAGSIVYPAGQNGVVGFKPSLGAVSRDRIVPISAAMDTAGPMAMSVMDVARLQTVLAAADETDPLSAAAAPLHGLDYTRSLTPDALVGVRIGLPTPADFPRQDDRAQLDTMVAVLTEAGATIIEFDFTPPQLDYLTVLKYGLHHGVDAYLAATQTPGATIRALADVIAFNQLDIPNRAPYGQDLLEAAGAENATAAEIEAQIQRNRVLAGKTLRDLLTRHDVTLLISLNNLLTGLYAPAGFPALCVPGIRRESGEPVGLTIVGDFLADARILAAGYAFEQALVRQQAE